MRTDLEQVWARDNSQRFGDVAWYPGCIACIGNHGTLHCGILMYLASARSYRVINCNFIFLVIERSLNKKLHINVKKWTTINKWTVLFRNWKVVFAKQTLWRPFLINKPYLPGASKYAKYFIELLKQKM